MALAPRRVQLREHHRVGCGLAHVADPKFGSFKIGGMEDEFLHKERSSDQQLTPMEASFSSGGLSAPTPQVRGEAPFSSGGLCAPTCQVRVGTD